MRYLSLHLPFLATDRIRRLAGTRREGRGARHDDARREGRGARDDDARALVTAAKVKSAFRLAALDGRALALGLRTGMALADARAMHPGLAVHAADPAGDIVLRDALTDWGRRFTPLAAPDGPDGMLLDVTGAAHLFGGEIALMQTLATRLAAQGFATNVALADTPAAAWALARFGSTCRRLEEGLTLDARTRIFAPMPLSALRLDTEIVARLGQAGLRRIGDLLLRPRAPIAARFGRHIHHRLDCLFDHARDPISPRFEAPPYLAERRFADGLTHRAGIEATIFALAHDLCKLLARHGEGARRLDVALYRVDGLVKHLEAGTSRPLRDPDTMARLFRERIEAAGEDGLDTGYGFDMIRLAALTVERLDAIQRDWAVTDADANDFADLVDRLGARLGSSRVTGLMASDTHRPEAATTTVPVLTRTKHGTSAASAVEQRAKALPDRPIRLLDRPEPIDAIAAVPDGPPLRFSWRRMTHHVAAIEGPERIGPEWWMPGRDDAAWTRDYFRVEDTEGHRFWLYREGLYCAVREPRWFLHGLFA